MLRPSSGICFLRGRVGYLLFLFTKMWARPWCLFMIIWAVFAQPCGRASKKFTWKSRLQFLSWRLILFHSLKKKKNYAGLFYVYIHLSLHMWRSENNLQLNSFLLPCVPWIQLRLSGRVASAFTHWVISWAPFLILFHVYEYFAYIYVYVLTWMPGVPWHQKMVLDFLQLELQLVVSHSVGTGNWIWIICRNSKCS